VSVVKAVRVDPADNVAVALTSIDRGTALTIDGIDLTVADDIPSGHKFALRPIAAGESAVRYGFPFGRATAPIAVGEHVHSHDVETMLGIDGATDYAGPPAPRAPAGAARTFAGYRRADGSAGTRNEIWIIPTVGCVGRTSERLATLAGRDLPPGIDGIHAFPHPFGCSQLSDDLSGTTRLIAALACHPNAGGVLLIGLGCESNQLRLVLDQIPPERRARIRTIGAQTSPDEIAEGLDLIAELAAIAAGDKRENMPISALRIGVKCGGSDGLSGLTANPLIGRVATAVGDAGGAVVLTEIPEMFGAEQILLDRCVDRTRFDELTGLVARFKRYFTDHGEPVSENPSPGNIKGGITTLEEKSLGAVQKGGAVPVTEVLPYAGRATRSGLAIVEGPGNDAVSTTALAAAGATITLFSTGRGTPLGSPVPTLKIASNSALAAAKPNWIDFDGGAALSAGMAPTAEALLDLVIATASGAPARNETNDERGIAIWKRGVTL
jgi:altronate hydrolase